MSRAVADWLNHNSNGRFTKIEDLIDYYDPFPDELGHTGRHGYTAKFENERYRVENAIFQTVQIIDDNDLICLDSEELDFKTWGEFFSFLDKNPQWKLVDILSGEIITKDDIMNERFAFHHNDRDKQQDSRDNLVFVFPHNHGVITLAQMYFPQLADFFEDLINTNINHITDGRIPQSWRTNWRVVALDKGLRLPKDKYRVKTAGNSVLEQNQTGLSKWIKKDSNFTNFCSFDGDFSCRDTF